MARPMNPQSARVLAHRYFPDWKEQVAETEVLDGWMRNDHEKSVYIPKHYNTNDEYDDLVDRSSTPWLTLGITSLVQTLFLDGVKRQGSNDVLASYNIWRQNRFNSRQNALYRDTLGHGQAFIMSLPGILPMTGEASAIWRGLSARSTAAWYEYPDDEWCLFAIHAEEEYDEKGQPGYRVELVDELAVYTLYCKGEGQNLEDWSYISAEEHDSGVPPLVRYTNMTDLSGRHTGEIEPFIPLAKRIDQSLFDRLIVQRFGAWKVRFITGLQRPAGMTEHQYQTELMKMKINDFLIATSDKTKFGTLEETQLDGFIKARDADIRDYAAVSQVPPYMFLGLSANMQAESLAAARSALMAKSAERKENLGESHEQLFRLSAKQTGNTAEMRAFDLESRWRDTEVRPLSQAADALGKLASQVGVPLEMLWSMIPSWTDSDVARAKALVESGTFDAMMRELSGQLGGAGGGDPFSQLGVQRGQVTQVP